MGNCRGRDQIRADRPPGVGVEKRELFWVTETLIAVAVLLS